MYCFQVVSKLFIIWNISEISSNMHNFVNETESSMAVLQGTTHDWKTVQYKVFIDCLSTIIQCHIIIK